MLHVSICESSRFAWGISKNGGEREFKKDFTNLRVPSLANKAPFA